jgi:hypothetical protein
MEVQMRVGNTLLAIGTLCAVAGCGVSPQQLDDLEARVGTQIAGAVAGLERQINDTDAKYANMLALEQQVKNGVEKIDKQATLLEHSGNAWLEILQTQRNVLREQLKSVDDQIAGLQPGK